MVELTDFESRNAAAMASALVIQPDADDASGAGETAQSKEATNNTNKGSGDIDDGNSAIDDVGSGEGAVSKAAEETDVKFSALFTYADRRVWIYMVLGSVGAAALGKKRGNAFRFLISFHIIVNAADAEQSCI